eukprot:5387163-Amphidinium_carterae.1
MTSTVCNKQPNENKAGIPSASDGNGAGDFAQPTKTSGRKGDGFIQNAKGGNRNTTRPGSVPNS